MKVYETQKIRNIALLGHAGAGKSTIAESILFMSGAINRKGSIEEHNSVSDYNEIEQERNSSLFATPLYTEWNDFKINMIDTPGYNDYIGELIAAVNVVDTGIIAINAQNAIEVGTENAWLYSEKRNLPVMFLINKLDFDQANFDKASEEIISRYGRSATIFQYPLQVGANFNSIVDVLSMKLIEFSDGKPSVKDLPASEKDKVEKLHNELVESIAESNEELMEKYLDNGELEESELLGALSSAITQRMIIQYFAALQSSMSELLLCLILFKIIFQIHHSYQFKMKLKQK
jgi:elongation factor G